MFWTLLLTLLAGASDAAHLRSLQMELADSPEPIAAVAEAPQVSLAVSPEPIAAVAEAPQVSLAASPEPIAAVAEAPEVSLSSPSPPIGEATATQGSKQIDVWAAALAKKTTDQALLTMFYISGQLKQVSSTALVFTYNDR